MIITVFNGNISTAFAGPDGAICAPATTYAMSATAAVAPSTGLWTQTSGPSGAAISNTSSPTTQITNLTSGVYVFRWTIQNGPCGNTVFDEMTLNVFNASSQTANAGPDQSLCSTNPSTTLAANNVTFPGTGQWTVVQGTATFANASSPSTTVSGLSIGTNVLQWTINNGPCAPSTTSDQVTILVYNNAQAPANAGPDFTACTSQGSITLTGTSFTFPATGTWALVSGSATITIFFLSELKFNITYVTIG
jgi:hypothetical protein